MDRDGVKALVLVSEGVQRGGGSPDWWMHGQSGRTWPSCLELFIWEEGLH